RRFLHGAGPAAEHRMTPGSQGFTRSPAGTPPPRFVGSFEGRSSRLPMSTSFKQDDAGFWSIRDF
ncbi:MAG: hypothetical protein WAP47_11345, partial [Candidatus Rokuibacteriota bacterium]